MYVKVKRVESENLSEVLPSLLELELHTANVVLLVDNQIVLYADKCLLSASPVLKEMLMSLEVRLDTLPHISMPGFSQESVFSFLRFLYKGFVVFENSDIQQEFLKLCANLKVNPPVVRETNELHSDACYQRVVLPIQDTLNDVINEEQDSEEVQDPEPAPKLQFRETPFVGSIRKYLCPQSNNNAPGDKFLDNLQSSSIDENDNETADHSSDSFNLTNTNGLNDKKVKEEKRRVIEGEIDPVETVEAGKHRCDGGGYDFESIRKHSLKVHVKVKKLKSNCYERDLETRKDYFVHDLSTPIKHKYSKRDGIKYSCHQCGHQATCLNRLKAHQENKHKGVRYSCNQCEYSATTRASLKRHQETNHEGVRYLCKQCEYQATTQRNLKRHQETKHEGIRYSCDQCEYQATQKNNLNRHKETNHEGVGYPCKQCEHQATTQEALKNHLESKHYGVGQTCRM